MATRNAAGARSALPTPYAFNTALHFDGLTQYVTIPDNNAYSYATTSALSISIWINPDTLLMSKTESTGYVEYLNKQAGSNYEWTFRMYSSGNTETPTRNNRCSFYVFQSSGGLGDGAAFEDVIVPGEWIHIVGTIDANKKVSIYKNGVLRSQITSALTLSNGTAPILVGSNVSQASLFQGSMDDLRIWNATLAPAEVLALYNTGANVKSSALVGWFKFDEGSGTTATDSSSTANNGTLTGAPQYIAGPTGVRRTLTSQPQGQTITSSIVPQNTPVRRFDAQPRQSLTLNGSSQYMTIANATQTGLDFGLSDFAIGGWFNISDTAAIQVLADKHSGTGYAQSNASNIGFDWLYRGDTDKSLAFRVTDGTNAATLSTFAGINKSRSGWHFYAVYGVGAGTYSSYVDGQVVGTGSMAAVTGTLTNTGAFNIGVRIDATTGWLKSNVDDFFVYNFGVGGLPANINDILDRIYRGRDFSPTGLKAFWDFDGNATDRTGANGLTATGSPTYSATITPRSARLAA